jgi:tetratricopeptide (TPR) repeat protein
MPGHIYIRVGRYHDAVIANEKAIAADQEYITQCHAQGLYPIGYMPHNRHFLWAAATMEGQSALALDAARHMAMHQDQSLMREPGYGTLQHYWITPVYALVRFGKWDQVLAEPRPAEDLLYPIGVWQYARGMAFLRKGRLEEADQALAQLTAIAGDPALEGVTIWDINTTASLLKIATDVLAGELAAAKGHVAEAVRHLEAAVALQDALTYDEPPPFHYPVRQSLGAVLLESGQPARAEAIYREDLATYPENGWSLFGQRESLKAQGKTQQAEAVRQRFEQAWRYADVTLTSSRY